MKKYLLNILLLLFLGATLFPSCEKDVTFEFDRPSKLCLNCILNPDSTISARLTLSRDIENSTTFEPVDDAKIVLYENDTELGTLTPRGEGNYYLNYHPKNQNEYKIVVLHPDFDNLTAQTVVPQKPIVGHRQDTLEYSEQGLYYLLDVYYEIHDTPGLTNYWLYGKHTVHGVTYSGGGFFTSSVKAPFIDNFNRQTDTEAQHGFTYSYYVRISDVGYDGSILRFSTYGKTGLFTSFLSADEHYDKYIKSSVKARMNSEGELPFKEPVQIYSNIKNGYGIFGACTITTIKL
ncbi:DUF4249 domain-containing protein [Mariniphaga sediminis]|uniref:DUF4249 domain-containing protein n=1 Tax=Mariniphaga sediminis TaxID=1628158 RepID=A0A399CTZ9_9BACT|nr:DUF4249 domain-containing protein [Mariniphaga sediminis]RIH63199.1 DUF4249 domain-containing protein [Mariniphaga sediminis]